MNPIEIARSKEMLNHNDKIEETQHKEMHEILVGEISALETYSQALDKIDTHPESQVLRNMLNDHKYAANFWKTRLKHNGEIPEKTSGAWGEVTQLFVGAAKVFGDTSTLLALKKGEEYGLNQYKQLLEDENLDLEIKETISSTFIPNQEKHINKIDSLIDS